MPVATYNLKPPQAKAIQIINDQQTLMLIAAFVGTDITNIAQLRAALGNNSQNQPAGMGDWVVQDLGGIGFSVLTNADFNRLYTLAT